MKVAVYHNNSDIRIEERPTPEIKNGELLVKVKCSGICGTDVMEWYRTKKSPRVLGHEMSGDIVKVGNGVSSFSEGERVFVSHHVPCDECKYCDEGNHTACPTLHTGNFDPGGFSEYVRVPKMNVEKGTYVLPRSMSYEEGTMIEPLACVLRGQKLIDIKKGQTVLVLGSGITGLLHIQVAKMKGTRVIATDVNEFRLKKAKEYGAEAIHATKKLDIKAEKVILCTGAMSAVQQAFTTVDKKGTILFFAIPSKNIEIPVLDFWRNEITHTSSYGAAPRDLEESLHLITEKKVDVGSMITHRLPLKNIQEGFSLVANPKDSLKVVITP